VLATAWWLLAPVYAHVLVALGRPLIPVIEHGPKTTYWVEGATIWTLRSVPNPETKQVESFRYELWKGYNSYDLILLAAAIVATPGWSLQQRGKLLGLGLLLITLTEFAFFLSTAQYSQLRLLPGVTGTMLVPPGFSRPKQIVFSWIYYFFQTMGRGMFPLLIYLAMVGVTWEPVAQGVPRKTQARASRNAPCPCGSGKKFKRCCGR
jgi:hypothetical protein